MASSSRPGESAHEEFTEWLTPEQLARELSLPVRTLYAWRTRRLGPKAVKFGKHLRYRRRDVEAWVEEQDRQQNGSRAS